MRAFRNETSSGGKFHNQVVKFKDTLAIYSRPMKQLGVQICSLLHFGQLQAKLANRSRSSIYRDLEQDGLPKPVKLGSRLYWTEDAIDAAIEQGAE